MSVKKAIIILVILAAAGGGFVYFALAKKPAAIYTTQAVTRGKIVQTVSETGTVKSVNETKLGFLNAGKIEKINFRVGDSVKKEDILAELDYSGLFTRAREAQANLDVARENLNKLLAGATREEIAVTSAGVDQAKTSYKAAQNELERTRDMATENIFQAQKTLDDLLNKDAGSLTTYEQSVTSAQTNLSNAKATHQRSIDNNKATTLAAIEDKLAVTNTALDTIDRTVKDEDAEDMISVKNSVYLTNTNIAYGEAKNLLAAAKSGLAAAKADNDDNTAVSAAEAGLAALNKTFYALQLCFSALEASITSSAFSQADLDTLKSGISSQQTLVAAAITALQTAKQNLDSAILNYTINVSASEESLAAAEAAYSNAVRNAENALSSAKYSGNQQITLAESKVNAGREALAVAEAQLKKITAPANKYDISLTEAKLRQAQAALDDTNKQIENSKIISPMDGLVTKIEYEVGEQSMSGSPVIYLLGEDKFDIEVLISEADISKIKTGNKAEITLDAYGEDRKFFGHIEFIEPAETVIQDVIYYKIDIGFDAGKEEIKSGMTANVVIIAAEKENALLIPGRSIVDKNGDGKFARILVGNQVQEKKITTGLRGDEGMVEILAGVNEGEPVITYIEEN
ncbi:MAG: efflux RND transporter periplasmic adaptor subunit [Candidatus Falkowbacteria bacterium]